MAGCRNEERTQEAVYVGVVTHDHNIFAIAILMDEVLKVVQRGFGGERVGEQYLGLIASFGADEGCSLHTALEFAGDDEIELYLHCIQHISELKTMALTIFIERALDVEQRIGAAGSSAGVTKNEKIHCVFILIYRTRPLNR